MRTDPRDAEATLRVFFALWPDASTRDALARLAHDVALRTEGRAPSTGNLHLTLVFLGDVAIERLPEVRKIGSAAADRSPRFGLMLDRVAAFRRTGIAWAGASAMPDALLRLVQGLNDMLAAAGFPIEHRAFQPHVTLARRCRTGYPVAPAAPIMWSVEGIALNASDLSSGGPAYRELGSFRLGGSATDDATSATTRTG